MLVRMCALLGVRIDESEYHYGIVGVHAQTGPLITMQGQIQIIAEGGANEYKYRESARKFRDHTPLPKPRPSNCRDRHQRVADVNRAPEIDL